ncbi:MAG: deoxyribodipyrimidine photolyase [Gemmatimonadota bacterium]|nr:deoxyribodipyrimidine photolyase [Gemmatimonadota bacterium]
MSEGQTPRARIRRLNDAAIRSDGRYVLYWMIATRRRGWSYGLGRAAEVAAELDRPILVLEPLRIAYPHASERLHSFVIDGMADNIDAFDDGRATYYPYVEPGHGDGSGLLETLSAEACAVVTDDFPAFFLPRMTEAAARRLDVPLESVDSNGLLPMRASGREWKTAYSFRRYVQQELPALLDEAPPRDPLASLPRRSPIELSEEIRSRWPDARDRFGEADPMRGLDLDSDVPPVSTPGGAAAGAATLDRFVARGLAAYEDRNHPDADAGSGLSPYLHFGHVSPHQVFEAVRDAEEWEPWRLADTADGKRSGWWGMSDAAEGFLDQIVTWRELGYQCAAYYGADYDSYDTVPEWARDTLAEHESDARPHTYTLEELETGRTSDDVWNAAQNQLRREGRIHNYMRMVWGKRMLEWTATPREAFERLVHLNDRWAIDGRDPNSYTGIGWVFGRHDRAWGPERPIFGKVRYMSSANTKRKLRVGEYLERYAGRASLFGEDSDRSGGSTG